MKIDVVPVPHARASHRRLDDLLAKCPDRTLEIGGASQDNRSMRSRC